MKRLAAIILLLAGCASDPEPKCRDYAAEVWADFADEVDDAEVSVALVRNGIPSFAGDPKAIYRLGSLTDLFVLEAARKIAARGEIDMDRPLTAYAHFAVDPLYGRLTLGELAELKPLPEESDAPPDFLDDRFPWASDPALVLFAALLEDATGKTVAEIVRDEITLPLQLRDTSFAPSADKLPRLAQRGESMDGLYSSVEDCVKFFAASDSLRRSPLLHRHEFGGVELAFAADRSLGCRRFVAYPEGSRDFLLIFRNVFCWSSQYRDFNVAAEVFAK